MNQHEKISYVEYPSVDLEATKAFFIEAFDWHFQDYGPDYVAFSNAGLEGGFYQAELMSRSIVGGALLVLFSQNLEETQSKIERAGGCITKPIFTFPGGRRFHFYEPSGNELAVWSDQ